MICQRSARPYAGAVKIRGGPEGKRQSRTRGNDSSPSSSSWRSNFSSSAIIISTYSPGRSDSFVNAHHRQCQNHSLPMHRLGRARQSAVAPVQPRMRRSGARWLRYSHDARIKASILVDHTAKTECEKRSSDRLNSVAAAAAFRELSSSHHILQAPASSRDRNDLVAGCRSAGHCATSRELTVEAFMPSSQDWQDGLPRCTQGSRDGNITVSRESAPKSTNLDSGFTCDRTDRRRKWQAGFQACNSHVFDHLIKHTVSFDLQVLGWQLANCGPGLVMDG